MSNYTCEYDKYIESAHAGIARSLNPADYLYCNDEDELRDSVEDDLNESIDTGDFMIYESDYECVIPEEFIQEWKNLKGYE